MSPLVEPGPPLDSDRVSRYSRQLMLPGFGEVAQRRLRNARVLVIGAGGLGSAVVPSLAAAGIGTIGIIDDDDVELSNLHRQLSHGVADIGRPKVDSLAETVAAIDPECRVNRHPVRVTSANLPEILAGYDLLIDGSDNFPTRYLANDAAVLAGVPLVWGAILRFHGQVGVSWHGHGPTWRDLFPAPPPADEALSCELGGVLPTLCPAIGAFLATEAIKLITGVGEPLIGRVLVYDALTARTREISYGVSDETPEVTELIDYDLFCGVDADDDLVAVAAADLLRRMRAGERLRLLDVREQHEADARRIDGSILLPIGDLRSGSLPDAGDETLVVYCEKDPRSRSAARILNERGFDDVVYLAGGIQAFAAVGGETVSSIREAL
ncbi:MULTISPECIES: ThiF family adenylyltransferase [unclassified Microbacterium]|uniref:ThiF family adenylyltransferase n=1 Tax=unclassified Microbacterium TaxID=2609290 RepID=UPI0012FA169C|nr:ThiF family adenylyltransferase [Microbacterium sp. MAH-37]MVQ43788.1 molybdopterin biosynthesis protein MoeB [Microbacterium sp. MAH-37]